MDKPLDEQLASAQLWNPFAVGTQWRYHNSSAVWLVIRAAYEPPARSTIMPPLILPRLRNVDTGAVIDLEDYESKLMILVVSKSENPPLDIDMAVCRAVGEWYWNADEHQWVSHKRIGKVDRQTLRRWDQHSNPRTCYKSWARRISHLFAKVGEDVVRAKFEAPHPDTSESEWYDEGVATLAPAYHPEPVIASVKPGTPALLRAVIADLFSKVGEGVARRKFALPLEDPDADTTV